MTTHHQLYYHLVFSTKNRKPYLQPNTRESMFEYLGGTVRGLDAVPIRIGGWVDHVHLLVKLKTTHRLSDFMRSLKASSAKQFNDNHDQIQKFGWQDGYGAFTVGPSTKPAVIRYIENQVSHHASEAFKSEYLRMLDAAGVGYDERYVFD